MSMRVQACTCKPGEHTSLHSLSTPPAPVPSSIPGAHSQGHGNSTVTFTAAPATCLRAGNWLATCSPDAPPGAPRLAAVFHWHRGGHGDPRGRRGQVSGAKRHSRPFMQRQHRLPQTLAPISITVLSQKERGEARRGAGSCPSAPPAGPLLPALPDPGWEVWCHLSPGWPTPQGDQVLRKSGKRQASGGKVPLRVPSGGPPLGGRVCSPCTRGWHGAGICSRPPGPAQPEDTTVPITLLRTLLRRRPRDCLARQGCV